MFKNFFRKQTKIIEETDPDKIFVENIRSYFNISTKEAKKICDIAVEEGVMRRKFGIDCKNEECGRIIDVYENIVDIPEKIHCLHCQLDEKHEFIFNFKDCNITEFFQYIDK